MKRLTIYDLARITGLSSGTISRAFNENTKIKAATRELVLRKAMEVGYRPHAGARAMSHGRTRRWGLLLPHLQNPRYSELMEQLDNDARQRSTLLLLGLSHYNATIEADLASHWASGEVDGIISNNCTDVMVFEKLQKREFPFVFLFGSPSLKFNSVTSDTTACCAQLVERMFQAGHRRIGYISQLFPHLRLHSSFVGYRQALAAHKLPLDESLIFFGSSDHVAGEEAWSRWRTSPQRPTAVLCFNDIVACGLIQSVQNDGYRVPLDLSVVGCDDIRMASFFNLTTIRSNPVDISREVFSLLERPPQSPAEQRFVPATIVERSSLGPVPSKPTKKRR